MNIYRRLYLHSFIFHYTCGITPKRVTSGDLAPGQRSYEETPQRWRAVGDTVSDLTELGIES